jgi:hypothetical protein
MMMSIDATMEQQGREGIEFLMELIDAHREGRLIPSLIPASDVQPPRDEMRGGIDQYGSVCVAYPEEEHCVLMGRKALRLHP